MGHYKDSLFKFQEAINGLPEGNQDMNHFVSLLLSKVLFAFGTSAHIELSKQELFKCFATDPNFIPAVICLCAMGIALDDFVLAQTAAAELIKLDPISMRGNEFDVDLVLSLLFSATSDPKTATRFLVKTVHRQPWLAGGWYRISLHLYCNSPRELNMSNNLTTSALRVNIQAASHIKTNSAGERSSLFLQYGLSKFEISGVDRKVKSSISKALFLSPSSAKNWTALSMALLEGQESLTVAKKLAVSAEKLEPSQFNQLIVLASELRYESIKNSVSKIEEISDTSSGHLKQVASAVLAHSMVTLGKHDQAIQLFEEAISLKGITYVWLNPSIRLSQILVERGLFDDALKCIARCKADFLPASHLFQAAILIWQGKFSEALASVGNVLKLDGENVLGKFQQTLLFRKLDAKKNHSRIERNFEYLEGKIDSIEMQWLKKC